MEKIWLSAYPSGVQETIQFDQYASIPSLLQTSCQLYGDRVAFSNEGSQVTYSELWQLTDHVAAYFQHVLRLKKGDHLAIMLPNLLQYPVVLFAALKLGLVVVNVNPLYTNDELTDIVKDCQPTAIIVLANFAHVVEDTLRHCEISHVVVTELGDLFGPVKSALANFIVKRIKRMVPRWHIPHAVKFTDIIKESSTLTLSPVDLQPSDTAFLQYTGGTTGVLKAAVLTHENLLANILQAAHWVSPRLKKGEEMVMCPLPLYHIFSLTVCCLAFITYGATIALITNPRDVPRFVKQLSKTRFTIMVGLNTLFNALLKNPEFNKIDFSELALTISGGMALQRHVAEDWQSATGSVILEGYGLTEASPVVTVNPVTVTGYTGSIGLPLSNTLISFRDDKDKEMPLTEIGELCVKGPQVMQEYWEKPEETAQVITESGWLRTGDLGYCNEQGYVFLVDRKKDIIIVSGFNVYPNEVEDTIAKIPGVVDVVVVGVPHKVKGEQIKAFVVKDDDYLTDKHIINHCREYLTAYKVPKLVEFRGELPKSAVGKPLRRLLRKEG